MNEPKSWDPTLVKKFSASNHFKLLNQLRIEVKKYPLNNKKTKVSNQINITNINKNNKVNSLLNNNESISVSSNQLNDGIRNKSTVSFNNAKNFSIYNTNNNTNTNSKNNKQNLDQTDSNDDLSHSKFKDRLDQIDLK